jgi:hypothetical protein
VHLPEAWLRMVPETFKKYMVRSLLAIHRRWRHIYIYIYTYTHRLLVRFSLESSVSLIRVSKHTKHTTCPDCIGSRYCFDVKRVHSSLWCLLHLDFINSVPDDSSFGLSHRSCSVCLLSRSCNSGCVLLCECVCARARVCTFTAEFRTW